MAGKAGLTAAVGETGMKEMRLLQDGQKYTAGRESV